LEPEAALGQVAADLPKPPHASGQLETLALLAGLVEAPLERGPQVVVFGIQALQPLAGLNALEELRFRARDHGEEPIPVTAQRVPRLARFEEAVTRVLPNGLQLAVA